MATRPKKIFLASSKELAADRDQFELSITHRNDRLEDDRQRLQVVRWETLSARLLKTRSQDEYNKVLRDCDLFVMMYHTKVGPYTAEEFDAAVTHFSRACE